MDINVTVRLLEVLNLVIANDKTSHDLREIAETKIKEILESI